MSAVNPQKHEDAQQRITAGVWQVDVDRGQFYGTHGQPIGYVNQCGYIHLAYVDSGKVTRVQAHRVIWEYVHGPITDPTLQINHMNGDKTDNRIANLELVDASGNVRHAYATGLAHGRKGTRHHGAKLNDEAVQAIRARWARGEQQNHLAREYGVSTATLGRVNHNAWRHIPRHPKVAAMSQVPVFPPPPRPLTPTVVSLSGVRFGKRGR